MSERTRRFITIAMAFQAGTLFAIALSEQKLIEVGFPWWMPVINLSLSAVSLAASVAVEKVFKPKVS